MKLDSFVSAAVGAEAPDQVQHQVLRIHSRREFSAEEILNVSGTFIHSLPVIHTDATSV
jgi:hypothetical protein